ncbi:MAG TPA: M24 family metallopeptidase [Candidatus Poseidoniales archaeon]|jgi:Xaa-Pro aminopeptidase|nr:MAG: Xaa-Pro aminopeptidase [Euryarchaeota archaeon]HIF46274.1 M24 family metallopeptidase [Candidatus Poseidoniales archaeon]HIL64813.1 M24 family metallopeptidase [Candidatus Poseidoniales archaeon]
MWDEILASIGPEPAQISLEEYRARQNRLLNQLRPDDLLIIPNPAHSTRSNDVEYPYRTSSDMIYLCGWTDLDSTMVAQQVNGAWEVTLFVQPKDVLSEIWEGRRLGKEGALENFAIDRAESKDDLEIVLIDMINSSKRILVKSAVDTTIDEIVNNCITAQSRDRQKLGIGPISVEDPSGRISELRLRKSAAEIDLMRYSAVVASHAHIEAMKNTKPGVGEWQLEGIIEGFFKYGKTSGIAYPCIIGSGDNATILHYTVNDDICEDGEILLIDAGCEYKGYASDITRSWPVNGKFSTSQAEIYQIVLDSQLAAIDACRIGNPYDLPHEIARGVLAQGLIDLGVISQNLEEALDPTDGELRFWYMHNTGHWIGLDVHDVGVYRPDNEPRLLEEGMVLTVEPGLYFGAWRPDVNCPEKYANIGIRIEDDILVTKDGPDVLSKNCPKTIEELEGIIGE